MKKIHLNKSHPKFLVFRNGGIGNTLMATPFFRNLKEFYPHSFVAVVVDEVGLILLKNNPYIDKLYTFNRKKDTLKHQMLLVKDLLADNYDVSFHLRSGIRNELLAFLSRIPNRVGFNLKGSFQFLTHNIKKKDRNRHVIYGALSIFPKVLQKQANFYYPELYLNEEKKNEAHTFFKKKGIKNKAFIVIHPTGVSMKFENWGLDFYAELINRIQQKLPYPIIIIGSNISEENKVKNYIKEHKNIIYVMWNDIAFKAELIRQAAFFIGNDSGPAHIAEAWNVPKVVVYRDDPANFKKWGPLKKDLTLILFQENLKNENIFGKIFNHFEK